MAKKKKFHDSRLKEAMGREHYAGKDERREQERKDFMMISEDHSSMANLPQQVMMKEYPKFMYGLDPDLDDTVRGIDKQMYDDMNQMKRHISKTKY